MARKVSFEEALGRLDEIVKRLEEGDVPLEESMKLYEEGMRLGSLCRRILSEAEERMKQLTEENADQAGDGDD
ncbi:MAG TPA: exodeoxyribonuclease VII small subunit [Candidatus Bathyarchaeia archaeon]|nr:exodeoxyribonuclease VII small subunit [Candidatus Bathyarchaeia archaeon]